MSHQVSLNKSSQILLKPFEEVKKTFINNKLLFILPIIVGLGLLFLSSMGGVGLFAHSAPQWLTSTVQMLGQSKAALYSMMIGGGIGGMGIIGLSIKGIFTKKTKKTLPGTDQIKNWSGVYEKEEPRIKGLLNNNYTKVFTPDTNLYTLYLRDDGGDIEAYYNITKDSAGESHITERVKEFSYMPIENLSVVKQ